MPTQPETRLQRKIRKALEKEVGGFWFKVHGGPFQIVGLPDLIGCVEGVFFGLEVKMPGKKAKPHQETVIRLINKSGGCAAVVTSVEEAIDIVNDRLSKK